MNWASSSASAVRPSARPLRVLQTMGYVTIVHGKGAFIKACQPSSEEAERWFEGNIFALRDIYMVREALEPLVAREAARHITEEALAELRQIVDQTAHAAALPPEDANANLMGPARREVP